MSYIQNENSEKDSLFIYTFYIFDSMRCKKNNNKGNFSKSRSKTMFGKYVNDIRRSVV